MYIYRLTSRRNILLQDLNHWVNGWVDWNIALDPKGGPNWVSNFADSTVIVDEEKQTFYKQPMFYALGQFSRFLERDAIRIAAAPESKINGVGTVAFQNPNGTIAVVLLNYNAATAVSITLVDGDSSIPVTLEPMSINTVIYRLPEKEKDVSHIKLQREYLFQKNANLDNVLGVEHSACEIAVSNTV